MSLRRGLHLVMMNLRVGGTGAPARTTHLQPPLPGTTSRLLGISLLELNTFPTDAPSIQI